MAQRKILENWKAIEETEKKVQEQTGDPKAGFNASTFFLGSPEGRHLMIPCMYRSKKRFAREGDDGFTASYKEMNVFAKFCPFTGKPLYEEIPDEELEK